MAIALPRGTASTGQCSNCFVCKIVCFAIVRVRNQFKTDPGGDLASQTKVFKLSR